MMQLLRGLISAQKDVKCRMVKAFQPQVKGQDYRSPTDGYSREVS